MYKINTLWSFKTWEEIAKSLPPHGKTAIDIINHNISAIEACRNQSLPKWYRNVLDADEWHWNLSHTI